MITRLHELVGKALGIWAGGVQEIIVCRSCAKSITFLTFKDLLKIVAFRVIM